jgi:copper chaperone CopZ
MESRDQPTVTLSWHVPALVERPAVGTSCCATTAEALVSSELFLIPGVLDITINVAQGQLQVVTDPSRVDASVVSAALDDIGYPPKSVVAIGTSDPGQ